MSGSAGSSRSSTPMDGAPKKRPKTRRPTPPWRQPPLNVFEEAERESERMDSRKKELLAAAISEKEGLTKHREPNMRLVEAVFVFQETEGNYWQIDQEPVESVLQRWEEH
eukprot:12412179-Karenia_brevis.AAC.1